MSEVKKESKTKKTTTKAKTTVAKKETKTTKVVRKVKAETVKESKGLLKKEEQRTYKLLSNIIYIISKICRVCLMIFLPFVVLSMVFIPIVFKRFEVSANILKFDNISIIIRENGVSTKFGDTVYSVNCNTLELDQILTFLTNNSKSSIILHFEASLLLLAVIVILSIYLLSYIENLFANFMLGKTPFTKENTDYMFKIAVYSLALKVACLCFSLVGVFTKCFISVNLLAIVIMFAVYYVFKYATCMQEVTDTKLCD